MMAADSHVVIGNHIKKKNVSRFLIKYQLNLMKKQKKLVINKKMVQV